MKTVKCFCGAEVETSTTSDLRTFMRETGWVIVASHGEKAIHKVCPGCYGKAYKLANKILAIIPDNMIIFRSLLKEDGR